MKSDTINMNRPRSRRTSGSDPMNAPYSLGTHGQFDLWSWISQQDSWVRQVSISLSVCLDFCEGQLNFQTSFSLLSYTARTFRKLSSSVFKLHFTGCLEFKEAPRSFDGSCFRIWVKNYDCCIPGTPFLWHQVSQVFISGDQKVQHWFTWKGLFSKLLTPLLLWKQNKAKSWI